MKRLPLGERRNGGGSGRNGGGAGRNGGGSGRNGGGSGRNEGVQGGAEGAQGSFPLDLIWCRTTFLYHHRCHYPYHLLPVLFLQLGSPLPSQKASQTLPGTVPWFLGCSPSAHSADLCALLGPLPPPGGPQHLAQLRLKRWRTADLGPVLGRYSEMFNHSSRNKTQGARPGSNCSRLPITDQDQGPERSRHLLWVTQHTGGSHSRSHAILPGLSAPPVGGQGTGPGEGNIAPLLGKLGKLRPKT